MVSTVVFCRCCLVMGAFAAVRHAGLGRLLTSQLIGLQDCPDDPAAHALLLNHLSFPFYCLLSCRANRQRTDLPSQQLFLGVLS